MRQTRTFISLLAVTVLWADRRAEGDADTGAANRVNSSATATGSAGRSDIGTSELTGGAGPGPAEAPAPTLPPCAQAGQPVSLPSEFPKSFPPPAATVMKANR